MPADKQPDHVVFLKEIPKTTVGKTAKSKLLTLVESELARELSYDSVSIDDGNKTVLKIAANVFKADVQDLSTSSNKDQISGWDSYAHLKFFGSSVESMGDFTC